MSPRPDDIKLDGHGSHRLLACLFRAAELASEHDNLDILAMAEELMDMIIEKWDTRPSA